MRRQQYRLSLLWYRAQKRWTSGIGELRGLTLENIEASIDDPDLVDALTPDYVNTATGLALHRFEWLEGDSIGGLPAQRWNHLIDVQPPPALQPEQGGPLLVHWTKGGPWFQNYRHAGAELAAEWFASRDAAFRLWD